MDSGQSRQAALLSASILAFVGAGLSPARTPVPVHIIIETKGCGASNAGQPIYVSLWHDSEQGLEDKIASFKTTQSHLNEKLRPGYFRALLSGRGCWEQADWFSLLPSRSRTVTLQFESFKAAPKTDYDVYYMRTGAVAGTIPTTVEKVTAIRSTEGPNHNSVAPIIAQVQSGAYYFDALSPGKYSIRAYIGNNVAESTVLVLTATLNRKDFYLGNFRQR